MNIAIIPLVLLCFSPNFRVTPPVPETEAKVVYVDAKNAFVVIDKGKGDGLGSDYEFEVIRKAGNQTKVLGSGRFEKYLGRDRMCKLIIDDGTVHQMQVDDIVLCRRKG